MKSYLAVILSLVLFLKCSGQDSIMKNMGIIKQADHKFIKNSNIKYKLVIMACDTCAPIINLGYRVLVDLTMRQWALVKGANCKEWLYMLKSKKSDWASNLILYNLFDR